MLLKACPRCRALIPQGRAYCPTCAPIAEAERQAKAERKAQYMRGVYNRRYNSRRDPRYLTFYRSKDWKATSRSKLQAVAWKCEARLEGCTHLAVEVHHIKPIQTDEGWSLRLEWSNLEAVCTSCHNKRHPEKFKKKSGPGAGVLDMKAILQEINSSEKNNS